MNLTEVSSTQRFKEVTINENFESIDYSSVYGKRLPVTEGLTWGYWGGRWGGFSVAAGTLTLTNGADNYVVVLRSTGAISISTASTNWDNTQLYARVYKITVAGSVVTAVEDHRAGPGGIFGPSSTTVSGPSSSTANAIARWDGTTGKLLKDSGVTISDTGVVTLTAGAVGAPALTLGDATTGPYRPAADSLAFANAGVLTLYLDAAGRVGIRQVPTASASQFNIGGTNGDATDSRIMRINQAFTSSNTSAQYALEISPTFSPSGASLTSIRNIYQEPIITGTAINVTNFFGNLVVLRTLAGYTGTVTNGAAFRGGNPNIAGTNPFTNYTHFHGEAVSNGNGITSGTVTNIGVDIAAFTAAAGSGGTVNNYAARLTVPSGSNAANTNNGLRITGNGGAASTNFAIYCDSTADSVHVGDLRIGSTTAPTVALDVTGSALVSVNFGVTGVTGLGIASSSTATLTVAASVAGVASLRIPHGTAPSSPVNGDVWTTTAGLFVRVNGSTIGPLS